jgi:hypothetical protein
MAEISHHRILINLLRSDRPLPVQRSLPSQTFKYQYFDILYFLAFLIYFSSFCILVIFFWIKYSGRRCEKLKNKTEREK